MSVEKIWDEGGHNVFTDIRHWHNRWWVIFRETQGHVTSDGHIRVITSEDGDTWESAALLAEEGIDLCDSKLSVTPDDRLTIAAGGPFTVTTSSLASSRGSPSPRTGTPGPRQGVG